MTGQLNVLIEKRSHIFGAAGILATPCYPAIYYAGFIEDVYKHGPCPSDNSTRLFHRTLELARQALNDLCAEACYLCEKRAQAGRLKRDVKDASVLLCDWCDKETA